jgi:hypothetical protein
MDEASPATPAPITITFIGGYNNAQHGLMLKLTIQVSKGSHGVRHLTNGPYNDNADFQMLLLCRHYRQPALLLVETL